ncbi:hypothetical protein QE152_g9157 [Popillia japonica]|uniref:J domain-containing protein n=1 Tax=Popillia japonica TaxID=7064 RepID=A0AAW1LZM7_POPJA
MTSTTFDTDSISLRYRYEQNSAIACSAMSRQTSKLDIEKTRNRSLSYEAKEVLCDPEKRNNYDKWRNSGISISYKQWLGMKEHVHQSMHWSTPKTKDRMLPESGGSSGPSSLGAGGMSALVAHRDLHL